MAHISSARDRLEQASGLDGVLDATYEAFEAMLSVTTAHEDPGSGLFAAFVMAAASAADGRDAVASATSLPELPLHRPPVGETQLPGTSHSDTADAVAALSQLAAGRLEEVSMLARDPG